MKKKFSETMNDYKKRQKRDIVLALVINGVAIIGVLTALVVIPKK